MDMQGATTLVMIPISELEFIKATQQEILFHIKQLMDNRQKEADNSIAINYITALEFMGAVRIGRTKFDELVADNKIKTIKKKRKIYVPITEIERYFNDPTIQ